MRVTLGKHGVLTTEEARKLAKGKLAAMAHDINPNAVEREERTKAITLQEVYDEYIGTRRLKPKTLRDYGSGANGDVTAGYIVPDVERLRDPIQAITDYMLKAAAQKPTAKVVPIKREVTV